MRTNKILVVTEKEVREVTTKKELDMPMEKWIATVKKFIVPEAQTVKVYDAHKYHVCKYCYDIVKGADEDVLCEDCRETFGHAFFSQL